MDLCVPYRDLDSLLPTFFDLMAKDSIHSSLEAIFRYCMAQLADGIPSLRKYLPFTDNAYTVLLGVIDIAYILEYEATLVEHYLGLRRSDVSRGVEVKKNDRETNHSKTPLSWVAKKTSIVEIVTKALWRKLLINFRQEAPIDKLSPLLIIIKRVVNRSIPWIHAMFGLTKLVLGIAYAHKQAFTVSPVLWAQGLMLVHLSSADIRDHSKKILDSRLRITFLALAIIAKISHWYFGTSHFATRGSEETSRCAKKAFMIPPPPEIAGKALTSDNQCPLCDRTITNHTLNVASGRMFCYPCIRKHIESEGTCPVTGISTSVAQLRRMYLSD